MIVTEHSLRVLEHAFALPPTSLIICSRNRAQLLSELVESVLEGEVLPTEIVVVDDSHTHNEGLARREPPPGCEICYVWTRSVGLSRANNDGIRAAKHDILVFTQDDVRVARDWFGTIVRALLNAPSRSIVTGRVPPGETDDEERFAPSTISAEMARVYEGAVGEGILYVQNMALHRSAYEEIGEFDERLGPGTAFPAAEDNDYMYRLLNAGYRIIYCPEAVVYHRAWRSAENFLPLRWNYGLGRGAVYAKHANANFVRAQMRWDVKVHLLGALRRVRRERARAYGDVLLAGGIVLGALRWKWQEWRRAWSG